LRTPSPRLRGEGARRADEGLTALASFVVVYALSVAIFFVSTRYRVPLLVAAVPLAGGGAIALWNRKRYVVVALAVGLLVLWDPKIDRGVAIERADMVIIDIERGHAAGAIPRIEEVALEHPAPAQLYRDAGIAFEKAKHRDRAIAMWERALLAERGDPEAQLDASVRLVEAYIAEKRREDAMRLAKSLDPSRFDAVHAAWIGEYALALQDGPTALAFLRRAVELRPDSAEAHHNLATAYVMSKDPDSAMRELETALRLDPRRPSTLLNLAVLRAQRGEFAAARRDATEALRLQPDYPQAQRLLEALRGR
jgi:tetratricopeptide (TPR) repeat protein